MNEPSLFQTGRKQPLSQTHLFLSTAAVDDLPNIYLKEQVLVPNGYSCLINAREHEICANAYQLPRKNNESN
jgi:hypothetical protein